MTDENIDFIKNIVEQQTNQIVRQDSDVKGIFDVEVMNDGTYNVKIHSGTDNEARMIEGVDKDKLLELMKNNL